jgi:hypothetical protein
MFLCVLINHRWRCLDTLEPTIKENEGLKVEVEFLRGQVKKLQDWETTMSADKAAHV